MPKVGKTKYYAVRIGREGPKIYGSWDECKLNVSRYPGASHKSFTSRNLAEDWLATTANTAGVSNYLVERQSLAELSSKPPDPSASLESLESPSEPSNNKKYEDPSTSHIVLSPEQNIVLKRVKEGRNVFFTGSAGTGKSVLLREIIRISGGSSSATLGITASTGIASVNIGGTTLHSWAGIGLGHESANNLAGKFLGQPKFVNVLERWQQVETLIIDEISMIDGDLFDKLEYIARRVRKNDAPFGGIQLVLSGDFCQLPPVPERKDGVQVPAIFAFDAKTWDHCVGLPVILTRVFRQKNQAFVNMLNAMRFGELDQKTVEAFRKLSRPVRYTDGIEPTELFPTRGEVDRANNSRLSELADQVHTFKSDDSPGRDSKGEWISQTQMERLLERLIVPKFVPLKAGAQVMLIKNLIQGELVNGSVGQVVRFSTSVEARRNDTEVAQADNPRSEQLVSPGNGAQPQFVQNDRVWPVVRFVGGREMLMIPAEFTVNNADGEMEARRSQIPLILAWALSVHKSQGQTLERVKVDLRRTFEKGQAYVALSRATSMEQLQVLNFDPSKVVAHPRVLAWHRGTNEDSEMYFDDDDEMDNEEAIAAFYQS